MSASVTNNQGPLSFEEVYDIVKRNDTAKFDLVYRTLLDKSEYLTLIPNNEIYSILHHIVSHGALDLFNKVIAIPNIRVILLTKSLGKPGKDILQIAGENRTKSNKYKQLYQTIDRLVQMDKFAEYGKSNEIDECKKMLALDEDLVNQKPPYRKYYLIHHLAYANNREAFDQLRELCNFDMKLLTSDQKTASEVAFQQVHTDFANYLETLSPEMRAIREQHQKEKQAQNQVQIKQDDRLEKLLIELGGTNMLDRFTCPLTKEIFHDPVVLSDGFTYERSAIQQWLDLGNHRSPMTNIELTNVELEKLFTKQRRIS
ncbi:unnamed protein product [Adineta steineri]|uniref:U-box domain-containing protein n=1 Tax=Adineta steineri TaxID=433720 RepID=A0A813NJI5_9BILA|nr:unnamed protein product [Adineta steineri]CAF0739366.1 unnamed protein product [Adineta steineri]CAF0770779.1 unnamed protein product [Adineta steineri]